MLEVSLWVHWKCKRFCLSYSTFHHDNFKIGLFVCCLSGRKCGGTQQRHEKVVSGPNGYPSFKMHVLLATVEVARLIEKKRKRIYEDVQITKYREILSNYKPKFMSERKSDQ